MELICHFCHSKNSDNWRVANLASFALNITSSPLTRARSGSHCHGADGRDLEVSGNVEPGPDSAPAWGKAE